MPNKTCDIAVIGGGPAGMAAAYTAASGGASVVLIDANDTLGGHFYKELSTGTSAKQKKQLEFERRKQALIQSGVEILLGAGVWGVFDEEGNTFKKQAEQTNSKFTLRLEHSSKGITSVQAKKLIVATGVYDRPLPFPGWDLPGVLTPGGVQMQIEKQGMLPGRHVLVAGSGPLQMIVAATLARHGVDVVAVLDTCGALEGFSKALPLLSALWSRLQEGGKSLSALVRHRVPIHFRHAIYRAIGSPETGVQGVTIGKVDVRGYPIPGTERNLQVDTICVAYGFAPSTAMTLHLNCEHHFDPYLQAFKPTHDDLLQASQPGVFLAGDLTGVGGKPLANLQGQLAAISALEQLKKISKKQANNKRKRLAPAVRRESRFAKWLWNRYRMRPGLLKLADAETLLCRCEAVNISQFKKSLESGAQDLFGVKLRTRLGMGQCQGRYCVSNAALFLSEQLGKPTSQLHPPSIRPPIFPVRLKNIAIKEETFDIEV